MHIKGVLPITFAFSSPNSGGKLEIIWVTNLGKYILDILLGDRISRIAPLLP